MRPAHRKTKKQLIEHFPCALCGTGSKNERTFAERLREWLGKWGENRIALAERWAVMVALGDDRT